MALTPGRNRADIAGLLGEAPADLPDDENPVDHGLDSARVMALAGRRRPAPGTGTAFGAPAEKPAIEHRASLPGVQG
ncbi:isochorismatase [Streptomyces sp. NPDC020379]|uniref:isochorismatase n=1 Tax=Streptomyces sp. NPDC020379 TaxID=3365071 RepID=UPI00379C8EEC